MAVPALLSQNKARRLSLASLLAGILAFVAMLVPAYLSAQVFGDINGFFAESDLAQLPLLFGGMVVAFLAGLVGWTTGIMALACTLQEGRTRRCGRLAITGIALGALAELIYLIVAGLLSAHLPPSTPLLTPRP